MDKPLAKGRGSQINLPNRFGGPWYELDFEQLEHDQEYLESLQNRPTEYIPDNSKSIVTENDSPDVGFRFSVNPYRGCSHGCAYCYARQTHEYLGWSAGLDFETKILVKEKAPQLFREFLCRDTWKPEVIAMSGVVGNYDCPYEGQLEDGLKVFPGWQPPVADARGSHNIRGNATEGVPYGAGMLAILLFCGSLLLALVYGRSRTRFTVEAQEPTPNRDVVIAVWPGRRGFEDSAPATPYDGPSVKGVNSRTLTGKIMCGYQGWFTAPGDASGRGWRHYSAKGHFKPGFCGIDLWPDVSELEEDEKYATPFRHSDGRVAYVYSSRNRKTVLRHFRWMQEYGIDGVFVQRFGVETVSPKDLRHCNTVLSRCREGANRYGRCYAIMYDLSGLPKMGVQQVIEDWKLLVDRMRIGKDPKDTAYVRHNGKPIVAVWGIGFNDGRKYTFEECERLVDFLKNDHKYGGFAVLLGVPTGWRTLDLDSVKDPALYRIIAKADIISPWTVGRYRSLRGVVDHARQRWKKDLEWCHAKSKDYLPVVFPGFSRHNQHPKAPLDEIPRLKGRFLWKQYVEAKRAGATMIYQAMFDEMDEGTAIFKCTNDPPVANDAPVSRFLTLEDLPSDHYMWLCGMAGKLLRGEIKVSNDPPQRKPV